MKKNYNNTINNTYAELCSKLLIAPETNGTREICDVRLEVKNPKEYMIPCRIQSLPYTLAELLWYFMGSNDVNFISKYASLWKSISDDNITNNSAYGYIINDKFGFNQLNLVVDILKKNKFSRRALININVPHDNVIETKDEPCTIALQFMIRNNQLNCSVYMRSNDLVFGLPYDFTFFKSLQIIIADLLDLPIGTYIHNATSLHVYNKDIKKLKGYILNKIDGIKSPKINILELYYRKHEIWRYLLDKLELGFHPETSIIETCKYYNIID